MRYDFLAQGAQSLRPARLSAPSGRVLGLAATLRSQSWSQDWERVAHALGVSLLEFRM